MIEVPNVTSKVFKVFDETEYRRMLLMKAHDDVLSLARLRFPSSNNDEFSYAQEYRNRVIGEAIMSLKNILEYKQFFNNFNFLMYIKKSIKELASDELSFNDKCELASDIMTEIQKEYTCL